MGKMPSNCNSLELAEGAKEFCKFTCKWVFKRSGRKRIVCDEGKMEKKRISKGRIKDPQSICLVLERDHLEFIRKQALQRSVEKGRVVEVNELIRESLAVAFPAPQQFDMFGGSK